MFSRPVRLRRAAVVLSALVLLAVSCGEVDDSDTEADAVSRAAGTLGNVDLSLVVDEISSGLGQLGQSQQRAMQGVADGNETCTDPATNRARPAPSQVEVEIVSVVDGCLIFNYDVANFRTLIEDLARLREPDAVIAVSPLLLDYKLDQIDSSWPVQAVDGSSVLSRANGPTGAGVVVAVIDSGIDVTHPSLEQASIQRAPDSGQGDYTETGHGTVAAAIMVGPIAGSARGIAPGIELLDVPADLCGPDECGCDPCAAMTAAEAIRWSTDNGADIISMSFGFLPAPKPSWWQILLDAGEMQSTTETIEIALAYARANDVAMAAAAGNCAQGPSKQCEAEDQFEIPAGHSGVIGVAAISSDEDGRPERAWYSTRQNYVELAAPGNLILVDGDDSPIEKNGTSYATPFVSAALAVLVGTDGPLSDHPEALNAAREILATTAADIEPEGRDAASGYGQLQLGAALVAAEELVDSQPVPIED